MKTITTKAFLLFYLGANNKTRRQNGLNKVKKNKGNGPTRILGSAQALIRIGMLLFSLGLFAQEGCYTYFPNTIGNEWSYSTYDKRGRLTHSTLHTLKVLHPGAATVRTISFDKDGEPLGLKDKDGNIEVMEVDFDVVCSDGDLYMPPESFSSSFFNLFQGLEAEVTGDNVLMSYADMAEAITLPDYDLQIQIKAARLKIDISVTDREVIGQETLETPAGTFDCFKVAYNTNTRMSIINKNHTMVAWIAPGIGMVKSETRKGNGRVISKTVLEYKNW